MKLVDFELSTNGCDKENKTLSLQVRCLIAHFFRYYKNIDTENVKKIIIDFEEPGADYYSHLEVDIPIYENLLGVARLRREFDFSKYWALSEVERREYAFIEFIKGIKDVCLRERISTAHIDDIASKIREDKYTFQGFWKKKAISNPSKTMTARVFFKYLSEVIEIYAEIKKGKSDPKLFLMEKISPPYLDEFVNAFGKVYWKSDAVLALKKKKGDKEVKIDICEEK